jgi:hypothetical protein
MDLAEREKDEVEGLAPVLKCLIEIQSSVQNGEPVRAGLTNFLRVSDQREEFAADLRRFLFAWDQGHDWRRRFFSSNFSTRSRRLQSPYRRALIEILAAGLAGQPVLTHLEELRLEIERACEIEIKGHLESLPLKMLVPLLLFQFPAFLLLLFGPLLNRLIQELNR